MLNFGRNLVIHRKIPRKYAPKPIKFNKNQLGPLTTPEHPLII